jgi:hypothetical protein
MQQVCSTPWTAPCCIMEKKLWRESNISLLEEKIILWVIALYVKQALPCFQRKLHKPLTIVVSVAQTTYFDVFCRKYQHYILLVAQRSNEKLNLLTTIWKLGPTVSDDVGSTRHQLAFLQILKVMKNSDKWNNIKNKSKVFTTFLCDMAKIWWIFKLFKEIYFLVFEDRSNMENFNII